MHLGWISCCLVVLSFLLPGPAGAFVRIEAQDGAAAATQAADVSDSPMAALVREIEWITGLQLDVRKGYIRTRMASDRPRFWAPLPSVPSPVLRGSGTARTLFLSALQSMNVYKLRSGKGATLGRVFKGDMIEIDFLDAKYLSFRGVPAGAFNSGMVFFHELVHRHLLLKDPTVPEIRYDRNSRGAAVEYVNRIERELQYPERRQYFPRRNPVPGSSGYCIFFGEHGARIEIDERLFRTVLESGTMRGYASLLAQE